MQSLNRMLAIGLLLGFPSYSLAQTAEPSPIQKKLGEAISQFGIKLFKEIVRQGKPENVLISPFSVAMALTMTENGASGKTLESMRATLEVTGLKEQEVNAGFQELFKGLTSSGPNVQIDIANSIWLRQGFQVKPEFRATNALFFFSAIQTVDFAAPSALGTINSWVASKTHKMIPTILDQIPRDAIMYLINALYFKGKWQTAFDKAKTVPAEFTLTNGAKKKVKMMTLAGHELPYMESPLFQAIELPYKESSFGLIVLLPSKGVGLAKVLQELSSANWLDWTKRLSFEKGTVVLPRYECVYSKDLLSTLDEVGMGPALKESDFSRISQEKISISRVIHKTRMRVDEEGTEAAAATAVEMKRGISRPFSMVVDRPFLVAIYDRTGKVMLFLGQVLDPQAI